MRLNLVPLLFAASLIPLALTLQTIYLGYIGSSGFPHFIAFFSDSPPCTDGAIFGYTPEGFADNCNTNITILGHPDISFTGCKPVSTFPFTLPTAVSDGGTPALKCKPTTNPQGTATPYANCPYSPSASIVGPVELLEYCS